MEGFKYCGICGDKFFEEDMIEENNIFKCKNCNDSHYRLLKYNNSLRNLDDYKEE